MRNLYRAAAVRYLHDSAVQIAVVIAILSGLLFSITAGLGGYGESLTVDFKQFQFGSMLSLVSIVLSIGREFKDHTIRNKCITGYSRAKILCAEVFAAMTAAAVFCLLTVLPLSMYWNRLRALPLSALCKWALCILGMYLISAAAAAVVTLLVGNRTFAFLASGAVLWCVFALGYLGEGILLFSENRYQTRRLRDPDNPGEIIAEYEEKNPYYLPQPVRFALMAVNNANPTAALVQTQFLFDCIGKPEQEVSESLHTVSGRLNYMLPEQILLIAAVTAAGVRFFRKKDIA